MFLVSITHTDENISAHRELDAGSQLRLGKGSGKIGVNSLCVGGGMGVAMAVELC